ncbi:hypothetical protein NM688_g3338 [Phlebia brevispora]|uniref:Uncharacterized protein n=1 Tax=Phlebia brevispora TaxID=194682 RepID=A0ACC1T621_9APHY|nr:hypothetical protein NM688_g3338 [Phlebia brevispora]
MVSGISHDHHVPVPLDVQRHILDCICADSGLQHTLSQCMLVCQAWAEHCASTYYSRLNIRTSRTIEDVQHRVISSTGRYIREVTIRFGYDDDTVPVGWGIHTLRLLRTSLSHITSLTFIDHGMRATHILSPHFAMPPRLHHSFMALRQLTHLSFCSYDFGDARNLLMMLYALPNLIHFNGAYLTWRRAHPSPLPTQESRKLRTIDMQACGGIWSLPMLWTTPITGPTGADRFPGVSYSDICALRRILDSCDQRFWKGTACVKLLKSSQHEMQWTLVVGQSKQASVLEVHVACGNNAAGSSGHISSITLRCPTYAFDDMIDNMKTIAVDSANKLPFLTDIVIEEIVDWSFENAWKHASFQLGEARALLHIWRLDPSGRTLRRTDKSRGAGSDTLVPPSLTDMRLYANNVQAFEYLGFTVQDIKLGSEVLHVNLLQVYQSLRHFATIDLFSPVVFRSSSGRPLLVPMGATGLQSAIDAGLDADSTFHLTDTSSFNLVIVWPECRSWLDRIKLQSRENSIRSGLLVTRIAHSVEVFLKWLAETTSGQPIKASDLRLAGLLRVDVDSWQLVLHTKKLTVEFHTMDCYGSIQFRGVILPQEVYQPLVPDQSRPPVRFIVDDVLGIRLVDAIAWHGRLHGTGTVAPLTEANRITCRINWPGYEPWSHGLHVVDHNAQPYTLMRLAQAIARTIQEFFLDNTHVKTQEPRPDWDINSIPFESLYLLEIRHVSTGSWQPVISCIMTPSTTNMELA